ATSSTAHATSTARRHGRRRDTTPTRTAPSARPGSRPTRSNPTSPHLPCGGCGRPARPLPQHVVVYVCSHRPGRWLVGPLVTRVDPSPGQALYEPRLLGSGSQMPDLLVGQSVKSFTIGRFSMDCGC